MREAQSKQQIFDKLDIAAKYCAVLTGLMIPISTALMNVFGAATFIFVLASGNWKEKYKIVKNNPLIFWTLLLFLLLIIACTYSIAPIHDQLQTLKRYHHLILLPFFIYVFHSKKWRRIGFITFVAACVLNLLLSYINIYIKHQSLPYSFHDHISIGTFIAMTAFFMLLLFFECKNKWRWLFITLFILMSWNVFFMSTGRTEIMVYLALFLLALWQQKSWKGLISAVILIIIFFGVSFSVSHRLRYKVETTAKSIQVYSQTRGQTSVGKRLGWIRASFIFIKSSPIIGLGTGSFETAFKQRINTQKYAITNQANNDFLNITVQLGLIGFLVLLMLYTIQWRISFSLSWPYQQFGQIILVSFVVAGLFNSVLLDSITGNAYIYLTGLIFSAYIPTVLQDANFKRPSSSHL